jgi:hypothetical protein
MIDFDTNYAFAIPVTLISSFHLHPNLPFQRRHLRLQRIAFKYRLASPGPHRRQVFRVPHLESRGS